MLTIEAKDLKENDILISAELCNEKGEASFALCDMMRFVGYKCVVEQEVKGEIFTSIVDPKALRKLIWVIR